MWNESLCCELPEEANLRCLYCKQIAEHRFYSKNNICGSCLRKRVPVSFLKNKTFVFRVSKEGEVRLNS